MIIYRLTRHVSYEECPWILCMGVVVFCEGSTFYPASDTYSVCTPGNVTVSLSQAGTPYFEMPGDAVCETWDNPVKVSVN